MSNVIATGTMALWCYPPSTTGVVAGGLGPDGLHIGMPDDEVFDVVVKVAGATITLLHSAKLTVAIARAQHEAKHGKRTAFVVNKRTGVTKEFKAEV
jgi:hypothetical protein